MRTDKYGAWPQSEKELIDYIREQLDGPQTYNSAAESLANISVAAFNYAAHMQGATGFQAGWAGLQFIRIIRGIEGPFAILDSNQLLYPQYNLLGQVIEWIEKWKVELAPKAKEMLETVGDNAHPNVVEHWRQMAKLAEDK